MKKEALNPIKERGFNSKAQMRYLLMLMKEYPEKYSFVKDVLREHGVPDTDGPLRTYWEPPYNVSPETPSYVYTGKGRNAAVFNRIVRLADALDEAGKSNLAEELDDIMVEITERSNPLYAAKTFWSLYANDFKAAQATQDYEAMAKLLDETFENFLQKNYEDLSETEKVEARGYLSDLAMGREVTPNEAK